MALILLYPIPTIGLYKCLQAHIHTHTVQHHIFSSLKLEQIYSTFPEHIENCLKITKKIGILHTADLPNLTSLQM